jgi:hypothetical protein
MGSEANGFIKEQFQPMIKEAYVPSGERSMPRQQEH